MILFLDMDGVLCLDHRQALDTGCLECLDTLLDRVPSMAVVFNTAWNIKPLSQMQNLFREAGFRNVHRLVDQTPLSCGGLRPIQDWFKTHPEKIGPYIIIDDASQTYGLLKSRLVHCRPSKGFGPAALQKAVSIIQRPITVEGERQALYEAVTEAAKRMETETPWLSSTQRALYRYQMTRVRMECDEVPNETYLEKLYLIRSGRGSN